MERAVTVPEEQRAGRRESASELIRSAKRWEPWNPEHVFTEGLFLQEQATEKTDASNLYKKLVGEARQAYAHAVRLHPAHAEYQVFLGWLDFLDGEPEAAQHSIETALLLYPQRPWIWYEATRWYLVRWPSLSEKDRSRAKELLRIGAPSDPKRYVGLCWELLEKPALIREILPRDKRVRQQLLTDLTERQYFADRWAEKAAFPEMFQNEQGQGIRIISSGRIRSGEDLAQRAISTTDSPWQGTSAGWLSRYLRATTEVQLPPGEALLVIPMASQEADGIWPIMQVKTDDTWLSPWRLSSPNDELWYVLVNTQGGRLSLAAVLSNGQLVYRQGDFHERRVMLGQVRILLPSNLRTANF